MGIDLTSLNEKQRALIDLSDRERLRISPSGGGRTKMIRKLEGDEHQQFLGYLERNEYAYAHSRTDKPTTTNLGVPDFLVGALALEFKLPGNKLSPEQETWRRRHEARGHPYFVVSSYPQAIEILEKICKTP